MYNADTGTIGIRRGYFEETARKALQIAAKLGAVLQGDEGEYYRIVESGIETTRNRPRLD